MFSQKVADEALTACGRCCCICHKFCATKIELHHIKQQADGGDDTFENCIPLCFDCHSDMGKADPKHPKGRHYTERELKLHRDTWYKKVKGNHLAGEVCADDKALFDKICASFSDDVRVWLSEKDLRGTYPTYVFTPIVDMLYEEENPFFEFLNFKLEKLRGTLFEAIRMFWHFLTENTFPVHEAFPEIRSAPRIWLLEHDCMGDKEGSYEDFRNKHIKEFTEEGEQLNELATSVWKCYCDFVRQGRRIINQQK